MSNLEPIPRYRVRLNDAEVVLDALELLRRFLAREVFTSTEVCPVDGDWREFRFDPLLCQISAKAYRNLRQGQNPWFRLVCIAPWILWLLAPLIFLSSLQHWQPWMLIVIPVSVLFLTAWQQWLTDGNHWSDLSLWIPYWNCWFGWHRVRQWSAVLPERTRGWVLLLNWGVWLTLLAFFISTWWAPATRAGGMVVWGLLLLFVVEVLVLTVPFFRWQLRQWRQWRGLNPPLEDHSLEGVSLPFWVWRARCRGWGRAVGALLLASMFLMVAAGVALLPYYVIGKIRLAGVARQAGSEYPLTLAAWYPELPRPHAAAALTMELPACPCPVASEQELRDVLPQLTSIRAVLREYPQLGLRMTSFVDHPEFDRARRLLAYYLNWRQEELKRDENFDIAAFLLDIERISRYWEEEPAAGYWQSYLQSAWANLLSFRLWQCSDAQLQQVRGFLDGAEAAWRRKWKHFLWVDDLQWHQFAEAKWLYILAVPFGDNIQATSKTWLLEQFRLMEADYYENRADYAALREKGEKYEGIFCLFRLGKDEEIQANASARFRSLRALVACEQYRRRHGAYPDTLAQLVPEFLEQVPLDPFDGAPLRYLPGEVIYSVGVDGVDDGGRPGMDFGVHFPGKESGL